MMVVDVIYICIYILVQFVWHNTHVDFCHMYIVCCIHLIMYCMVERWEQRYKHTASLLLPLLLLLIVIYGGVVTYNETTTMDWYVDDDDVGLCQPTC